MSTNDLINQAKALYAEINRLEADHSNLLAKADSALNKHALKTVDLARKVQEIQKDPQYKTQQSIATAVGFGREHVSRLLSLVKFRADINASVADEVKERVEDGEVVAMRELLRYGIPKRYPSQTPKAKPKADDSSEEEETTEDEETEAEEGDDNVVPEETVSKRRQKKIRVSELINLFRKADEADDRIWAEIEKFTGKMSEEERVALKATVDAFKADSDKQWQQNHERIFPVITDAEIHEFMDGKSE